MRLFELGTAAAQQGVGLLDIAFPHLQDLHQRTRETVQLAVLDGLEVSYLVKLSGRRSARLDTRIGTSQPATCTGAGKALIAFSGPEFVDEVVARRGLPTRTSRSITEPDTLIADLHATRRRGYAIDQEEFQQGLVSVAVPIMVNGMPQGGDDNSGSG